MKASRAGVNLQNRVLIVNWTKGTATARITPRLGGPFAWYRALLLPWPI